MLFSLFYASCGYYTGDEPYLGRPQFKLNSVKYVEMFVLDVREEETGAPRRKPLTQRRTSLYGVESNSTEARLMEGILPSPFGQPCNRKTSFYLPPTMIDERLGSKNSRKQLGVNKRHTKCTEYEVQATLDPRLSTYCMFAQPRFLPKF